jgi:hypothetical protein
VEIELIAAIIQTESSWNDKAHRYEPRYQITYLEGTSWENDEAWLSEGSPTILEWGEWNPDRKDEIENLREYDLGLVAQTRVSSSYGLMQALYDTAVTYCDYKGDPEGLYDPAVNIDCGVSYLKFQMDRYKNSRTVYADAASAYNAGSNKWETEDRYKEYVEIALGYYNAFKAC